MAFKVIDVIDGDTFVVSPDWEWNGESGNVVRPVGYNTPEQSDPGFDQAKAALEELIDGEDVELIDPIKLTFGRLLCTVIFKGKDLADYFPQYQ